MKTVLCQKGGTLPLKIRSNELDKLMLVCSRFFSVSLFAISSIFTTLHFFSVSFHIMGIVTDFVNRDI